MKLLGTEISKDAWVHGLLSALSQTAKADAPQGPIRLDSSQARVDPVAFNLEAMAEHADSARELPLEGPAGAVDPLVLFLKRSFRAASQIFIDEMMARQILFNGHVRDAYAQLSADMSRFDERLKSLEQAPSVMQANTAKRAASSRSKRK
jgi:hypothetical protein